MSAANLLAYTRWHARDAVLRALVPAALFLVTAGIPLWLMARSYGMDAIRGGGPAHRQALETYMGALPLVILLSGLMVGAGFVSTDRERGHVRFLFATPVVAWQYYLLRFAVGLLLFTTAVSLVPLGFSVVFFAVDVLPVVLAAATFALLLGSLSMLAGAITRRDGAVVIVVTLGAALFQQAARTGDAPRWMELLAAALPPVNSASRLQEAWFKDQAIDTGDLSLVLGYALAMLVTALFTIRRAPLVR